MGTRGIYKKETLEDGSGCTRVGTLERTDLSAEKPRLISNDNS